MQLALCRCEASKPTDISLYFKGFATKQMHKDNWFMFYAVNNAG